MEMGLLGNKVCVIVIITVQSCFVIVGHTSAQLSFLSAGSV